MSMTMAEKLAMVKAILRLETDSEDTLIATYLEMAKREILTWRYSNANPENVPEEVPDIYEMTQVQAVVNGYTLSGNEGEVVHIENGTHFHFAHTDMLAYIRENVIPIAGVLRGTGGCGCAQADADEDAQTADGGDGDGT